MLSDQELQSLRNWGNLAEEAADEICALRAALAAQPAEPVALKPSALMRQCGLHDESASLASAPDMRHPKIQALIRIGARCRIEQQLVEQLLEDPNFETTAMDMEYWGPLHDKLKAALTAQPAEPVATSYADYQQRIGAPLTFFTSVAAQAYRAAATRDDVTHEDAMRVALQAVQGAAPTTQQE